MKKAKGTLIALMIYFIVLIGACIGTAYGAVHLADLPIDLPFRESIKYDAEIPQTTKNIMQQWANIVFYVPPEKHDTIEDMIADMDDMNIELPELDIKGICDMFPLVDRTTLEDYIKNNPEVAENGYELLFIDKVDLMNTPTGIKTVHDHDVLALDAINGIMIIGVDVPSSTGVSKVKLAVVNNPNQMDLSLVRDLSYWDIIEDHAKDTGAILAVNASGYNWHESGNYATMYGATKWRSEVYRKPSDVNDLICFDANGFMTLGTSIDDAYNAIEMMPAMIKEGVIVEYDDTTEIRSAMSAIGQTYEGVTLIATASGGVYGSNLGVKASDLTNIMNQYGAYNAVALSGGSRAIMYWNNRIVNETVGYDDHGVRLPNAIIVKPSSAIMSDSSEDAVVDAVNPEDETKVESSFNLNADGTSGASADVTTENGGETPAEGTDSSTTEG